VSVRSAPSFQDNSTLKLGKLAGVVAFASTESIIPLITALAGKEKPKSTNSKLEEEPKLANWLSSAIALVGLVTLFHKF